MSNNKIVLSSGHALHVRGAAKLIDEVDEARRVVDRVTAILTAGGVETIKFHDDTSKTQAKNLATIVTFHNKQVRALDVSVHFNAARYTEAARGCEVLHYDGKTRVQATRLSKAISKAGGLQNRGAKARTNLAFLRNTHKPALLIELCFVDSAADVKAYKDNFESICQEIAKTLAALVGMTLETPKREPLYKIRTGTFANKAQAEAAAEKAKRLNIVSVTHILSSNASKRYYFETGTFKAKADAEAALEKMKQNKIIWIGYVEEI